MITPLSEALAERGFTTLTDVQEAVTAPELADADLLVSAQTGSGKTVGFGLAIAKTLLGEEERMGPAAAPLAMVVAPTRELAMQVQRELMWLYAKTGAKVVSCIGGMDARDERRALDRGAHIVVGTPGRLRDHITRGALDLGDIRAIVLDEADEMLDLGFREDLEFMLGESPAERRTLLFSATVPSSIAELAKSYQRDAVRVTTLTGGKQHSDIEYQAIQVAAPDAEHAIINLLRYHDAPNAIVFANTRAAVARLTARFGNRGFAVVSLSGELSQDERSHALQALRDGRAKVCVATDVAARGIDLPNLELVIHADLPSNTEALLHRSGRTGRAGRKGISALIVPDKLSRKAARLLKWAKIEANWTFAPSPEDIRARDEERLMADPAWETELNADETTFAATLLEKFSAEQIAAACLRLYRTRLSAPEELNAPAPRDMRESRDSRDSRPNPRDSFGPSAWVSLSVGRDKNAEARWLLPMLCRTGNLEKSQIGKIRVGDTETFVELTESAIADFSQQLGADGLLENDIRAKVLDGVPEEASQPRPRFDGGKPPRKGPRPDREPRAERAPRAERPAHSDRAPREDRAPRGEGKFARPSKERSEKPSRPRSDAPKPRDKAVWDSAAPRGDRKPRKSAAPVERKEDTAPKPKPRPKNAADPSQRVRPAGKAGFDKPRSTSKGRPTDAKGKPAGKPFGGKPAAGKPAAGKPRAKPGSAAPGYRKGGDTPPRRKG